ncbi:MAG: bifunctional methylenetetrahydrofolate dehydrogenase/methenyltetrahydrofolate cyclohydrolase FolD [Deltaproteobacteria bacterium]|nr:bifunctional methylenetetrahydrofolate dehydrogenase/methenyltetrahydrofolate cyclohydrolase FolD [Deltaproteobacteria bacterium]
MIILDGKATAAAIRAELGEEVKTLVSKTGRAPGLAVILVGEDPASQVYVRNKEKACQGAGFLSETFRLPAAVGQAELETLIDRLNARDDVDGILLQLPLPHGLDSQRCLERIAPDKDVDGFHPVNMGKLTLGLPGLRPCTPAGVMVLLQRYGLSPNGKKAVVVGRSNIVGKPMMLLLAEKGANANATVTVCHSGTPDLGAVCREADFLVLAMGRPRSITGDMVKEGAVVVDVGINRTETGLCGDADYASVSERASAITPVPGGIGPMTIAQLLANTVQAYKAHCGL